MVSTRVPALDGLRGIALLLVLAGHLQVGATADVPSVLVHFFASGGWLGVDLFFVLSGFLITGILLDTRGGPGYLRNFFARRFLRIWPLFLILTLVAYLVGPQVERLHAEVLPHPLVWLAMLQNIHAALSSPDSPSGGFDHAWSLSVEEHVYLVLPIVVLVCRPRALTLALIAVLIAQPLLRILLLNAGATDRAL